MSNSQSPSGLEDRRAADGKFGTGRTATDADTASDRAGALHDRPGDDFADWEEDGFDRDDYDAFQAEGIERSEMMAWADEGVHDLDEILKRRDNPPWKDDDAAPEMSEQDRDGLEALEKFSDTDNVDMVYATDVAAAMHALERVVDRDVDGDLTDDQQQLYDELEAVSENPADYFVHENYRGGFYEELCDTDGSLNGLPDGVKVAVDWDKAAAVAFDRHASFEINGNTFHQW